jgi:starvation-inducible DNA-binding protein
MQPNIGLTEEQRKGVVDILNTLLADEYVLYTKTRNYHWNVTDMRFNDLHSFFETQYTQLEEMTDEVAERARMLGGWSRGTLTEFLQLTRLKEQPSNYPDAQQMLTDLLFDHETVIRYLRTDLETTADRYNDIGTNDFLTGLMERHEKMAWMLRAFVANTHRK